jgi:hypothetical protein
LAAVCDGCGSSHDVQRAFVTIWNGNVIDLCKRCSKPLVKLLDGIWFQDAAHRGRQ